jgi:hypothetical protein
VMTALRGASTRLIGSLNESRASRRVGPVYHCLSAQFSLVEGEKGSALNQGF